MTVSHIRIGTITIAHGELMAHIPVPVPGHLALSFNGPGMIIPIPGGVDHGEMGDMTGTELRCYLEHGMAFQGHLTFRDTGNGLSLAGARNMRAITDPDAVDHMILSGIMSVAEQIAGYRDARLRSGHEVTIEDWQGVEREDKTTADNIRLTIRSEESRLLITASDGRKLDLELQDGVLRALAYEAGEGKDSPVITALPPRGEIMIDREDYDRETRPAPDGPEM